MEETVVGARADALVGAPAGAALLAWLEMGERSDVPGRFWGPPSDVDDTAVAAASQRLPAMPLDRLLADAVAAAEAIAGPWTGDSPSRLARALRLAPDRRTLADGVVRRLGDLWDEPLRTDAQVWFMTDHPFDPDRPVWPALGTAREPAVAWMTATWAGLWTATDPSDELAAPCIDTWELFPGPVTRWRLTVDRSARVLEITGPDDWATLVTDHPLARRSRPNSSWEIPGPNQHLSEIGELAALPGQRALRTTMRAFVEPDWDAVAEHWDAVHLTWGGFLTTEGTAIDLDHGDVAMLRSWNSERTLWLNPVLDVGEALPDVPIPEGYDDQSPMRPDGPERRAQDLAWLAYRLGSTAPPAEWSRRGPDS